MADRWEKMETVKDFILGGSKITSDGDFSHEIKSHLLLERKAMTNLDSMLKRRDITLSTKVCLVKAMVFPVVMYGRESWTIKKAKWQRTDAFELWYWRRRWQPTPVFLPGESQGRWGLVGCCLWGRTKSDMTEAA